MNSFLIYKVGAMGTTISRRKECHIIQDNLYNNKISLMECFLVFFKHLTLTGSLEGFELEITFCGTVGQKRLLASLDLIASAVFT
jgi:hypothetical protein